jgi:RNA polymerase sigma-70 factor, ECF subfamily
MLKPDVNLTQLLRATAKGDRRSLDVLMEAIYQDLHRLASKHMHSERFDHTLQPTALVHEAYFKLMDQRVTNWADRMHFFAVASTIIRRILLDHARERKAAKRGGGRERVSIDEIQLLEGTSRVDIESLDEALIELAALDPQQARIVELRFFGGLTIEEVADVLDIGRRTVDRQWQCARAWLYCRLAKSMDEDGDAFRHTKGAGYD